MRSGIKSTYQDRARRLSPTRLPAGQARRLDLARTDPNFSRKRWEYMKELEVILGGSKQQRDKIKTRRRD
jgi:hypothetical protein